MSLPTLLDNPSAHLLTRRAPSDVPGRARTAAGFVLAAARLHPEEGGDKDPLPPTRPSKAARCRSTAVTAPDPGEGVAEPAPAGSGPPRSGRLARARGGNWPCDDDVCTRPAQSASPIRGRAGGRAAGGESIVPCRSRGRRRARPAYTRPVDGFDQEEDGGGARVREISDARGRRGRGSDRGRRGRFLLPAPGGPSMAEAVMRGAGFDPGKPECQETRGRQWEGGEGGSRKTTREEKVEEGERRALPGLPRAAGVDPPARGGAGLEPGT